MRAMTSPARELIARQEQEMTALLEQVEGMSRRHLAELYAGLEAAERQHRRLAVEIDVVREAIELKRSRGET